MTVKEVTAKDFNKKVLDSSGIVLVKFWAGWCDPCERMRPILDELAIELEEGDIEFYAVNVDEQPALASRFEIMAIPTCMIFKEGKVQESIIGVKDKKVFKDAIEKVWVG